MRIEHPDTYVCDVCGAEFDEQRSVNVPVVWTEGRPHVPYHGIEALDLCDRCADGVHVIAAADNHGDCTFAFREEDRRWTSAG